MGRFRLQFSALLVTCGLAAAQATTGVVEVPDGPHGPWTGIGLISGWHCTAGTIEVQVDSYPLMRAGARTPRPDTAGVCGRSDTGFSLTYNYNVLPVGGHTLRAYADGQLFAQASFQTIGFGVEWLSNAHGGCALYEFPSPGRMASAMWVESLQNFTLSYASPGPDPSEQFALPAGSFAGTARRSAIGTACMSGPLPMLTDVFIQTTVSVAPTVDQPARRMALALSVGDGRSCTISGTFARTGYDSFSIAVENPAAAAACFDLGQATIPNVLIQYGSFGPVPSSSMETLITIRVQAHGSPAAGAMCPRAQWLSVVAQRDRR